MAERAAEKQQETQTASSTEKARRLEAELLQAESVIKVMETVFFQENAYGKIVLEDMVPGSAGVSEDQIANNQAEESSSVQLKPSQRFFSNSAR